MAVQIVVTVGTTDYGFNFVDQEIEIEAGVTSVLAEDLKTAIHDAQDSEVGMAYDQIAIMGNPVVLDPGQGTSTFLNVVLLDSWRILTLSTSGTFTLEGGNIVSDATGVDVFAVNNLVSTVNLVSQAGVMVATGSGLTAPQAEQLLHIWRRLALDAANPLTNKDGGGLAATDIDIVATPSGSDIIQTRQ